MFCCPQDTPNYYCKICCSISWFQGFLTASIWKKGPLKVVVPQGFCKNVSLIQVWHICAVHCTGGLCRRRWFNCLTVMEGSLSIEFLEGVIITSHVVQNKDSSNQNNQPVHKGVAWCYIQWRSQTYIDFSQTCFQVAWHPLLDRTKTPKWLKCFFLEKVDPYTVEPSCD